MQPIVFIAASLTVVSGVLLIAFHGKVEQWMERIVVAVLPESITARIRAALVGPPWGAVIVGIGCVVLGVFGLRAAFIVS